MSDRHAVFAALTDNTYVRLSPYVGWHEAIERWEMLDDVRREHLHRETFTNVRYFAVRSENDPQWNVHPYRPTALQLAVGKGARDWKAPTRRLGAERGLHGREGGWIYNASGHALNQGWSSFYDQYRSEGLILSTFVESERPRDYRYFVNVYGPLIKATRSGETMSERNDAWNGRPARR